MKRHDVQVGDVLTRRHNGEKVTVVTVSHLPGESLFRVTPEEERGSAQVFTRSSAFAELPDLDA